MQLRRYMKLLEKEVGNKPRGILVHGGAAKLSEAVVSQAQDQRELPVEIVNYRLEIHFRPSLIGSNNSINPTGTLS